MKSLVIIILMFFSLNSYADCPIDEFVGKYKVVRAFCWQSDNGNYKEYIPENIPETIEIRRVSDDSAEVWRDNYGFSYNINSSKNNDLYVCKNTQNVKKVTSYLWDNPNISHVRYDEIKLIDGVKTYVSYSMAPYSNLTKYFESSCSYIFE